MQDKIAMITGANSGMGLATTVAMAKKGFQVIMVCRNPERGKQALQEAVQQSGADHIELMICDLGSLASIREFAEKYLARYQKLDVLINNAGVVSIKRETTTDGFEVMMGVNHLGHFLLTNLLLPPLKLAPDGRIVIVSSGAQKAGHLHLNNPHLSKGFNVWKGYAQSKLANVLFTKELEDQLKGTNVTVNCLHPGAVGTNIGVNRKTGFGKMIHSILRPFFLTPAQGAETAIFLATNPEVEQISGEYFYKKKIASLSPQAKSKESAEKLWRWSEQQVGLD